MSDPLLHSVVVSGSGAATVVPDVAQVEVSLEVVAADPATAYTKGNDGSRITWTAASRAPVPPFGWSPAGRLTDL